MVNVAVVGCGYWGPNLIRNFVSCPDTDLVWACDLDERRLEKVLSPYPVVRRTTDVKEVLSDDNVEAVAVATPVHTHFLIARACLESGKHVLVEKPLTASVAEGKELVSLSKEKDLQIMCDHTFCYTGAVRKIKEVIKTGILGEILYFDSVRINLGLFQQDVNVVWDLAPHDLSIVDFVVDKRPSHVSAHGVSHSGNNLENIAYISLGYNNSFIAHFHVNWLSPVKIRKTIVCGSEKMLVWDDLEPAEKVKIFDKGIEVKQGDREKKEQLLVSYRSGDMYAPRVSDREALSLVVKEFAQCVLENRLALTDGEAGLRVVRVLEAAQKSIKAGGATVPIDYS
ncbi:MAG: Gfo/Idh/MocA family oxidoreductase [Deltaproteobacteria bacterium]|nr:Gfo/Idh/MocA family oxidoreductase [Deltaproteobacteria bacterium]MBW1909659.1 Gfo/Idh/MocA family oxidoreductase [Deltaproteobacteria bacterium]